MWDQMANTVKPYKPLDKYGDLMFVPSVFVESQLFAYIAISLDGAACPLSAPCADVFTV